MTNEERDQHLKKGEEFCDQATALAKNGDYSAALDFFNKAEEIFVGIRDQHWLNFLRHEKLQTLRQLGKFDLALKLADQIADGYLETGNKHGLSLIKIHKADILSDHGDIVEALESLWTAEAIADSEKFTNLKGYIYSSISINLMSQENFALAIEYLQKALENYSPSDNMPECAWCLSQLGICYRAVCYLDKAEECLEGAYQGYFKAGDQESGHKVVDRLKQLYEISGQVQKLNRLDHKVHQVLQQCR